ncbi:sodium-coupled monocarboxylate transporter 1-like [Trichogramma pretiosum]|uniref:sodium-coupled monocarboxylate transporter 1-like n=1 Tax=Trichogramma pretiosum TaxID=7493 RepID=UPI0006C9AADD|nr:sodium-coupled monocarboxylate transporter 1-like [Trichogramma pretiosum]
MDLNATTAKSTVVVTMVLGQATKSLVFGWTDYLLFSALLGLSLFIGIFFAFCSKQDSAAEYLFGGKKMGYFPVAVSTVASMISGASLIGFPTEVYQYGSQIILLFVSFALGSVLTACVFMPVYYKLEVTSTYEYLELRFSPNLRYFASVMYVVSLMIYIPLVVYVPALAFSQISGANIHTITPVLSLVCITYTTIGGVKAVIWTDTIQFIFTLGGLFTFMFLGVKSAGGIAAVWKIADAGGRLDVFDFDPSPFARTTFWGLIIGMTFSNVSSVSIGQKYVQRLLSIKKESDLAKTLLWVGIGCFIIVVAVTITGITMYARYASCDPISAGAIDKSDKIVPYYIMDIAGDLPGLPGIFLAGIVSSALSTMSAALNTLSGTIYEDFIDRWIPESPKKDAKAALIMKGISFLIGLITIALIFLIEHLGSIFEMAMSLRSVVEGPMLGIFLCGMFLPKVGKRGALWGGIVSLLIMAWILGGSKWYSSQGRLKNPTLPMSTENCSAISFPASMLDNATTTSTTTKSPILDPALVAADEPMLIYKISMLYLVMVGTIIAVVVAVAVSWMTGEWNTTETHPDLLSPVVKRFYAKKSSSSYDEVATDERQLHDHALKKLNDQHQLHTDELKDT